MKPKTIYQILTKSKFSAREYIAYEDKNLDRCLKEHTNLKTRYPDCKFRVIQHTVIDKEIKRK